MTEQWYEAYLEARIARGLGGTDTENRRRIGAQHYHSDPLFTPDDAAHADMVALFVPLSEMD